MPLKDDIILHRENPKESTKKKLLEIINDFDKVSEYKIDIEKKQLCFYTLTTDDLKNKLRK